MAFSYPVIGEGGSAVVHKGRYKDMEVAIKCLKVSDSNSIGADISTDTNSSKAFNEFRRECWVMTYVVVAVCLLFSC